MRELDVRSGRGFQTGAGKAAAALLDDETSGPLQLGAYLVGALAIAFIVVNAVFMQTRPHPAPIFQTRTEGSLHGGKPLMKSTDRIPVDPLADSQTIQIQQLQMRLQSLGYDVGEVDGVFGFRTENAIIAFERDHGYPEAGRVTPLLMKRLNRPRPATKSSPVGVPVSRQSAKPGISDQSGGTGTRDPVARPADRGTASGRSPDRDEILLVQRALSDLGYGPIEIDGLLGSQTAQAIQRFELDRGMSITGTIGDRIIAELVLIGGVKPIATR